MSSSRRQPPKVPRPDPVPRALSPALAALARDPSPDAVDAFWAAHDLPLVEPAPPGYDDSHALVTFCLREADAEQVLLFVNRVTDETRLDESLLRRLPGTDLWHVGYVMETDWRASYAFLVQRPGERAAWLGDGDQVAIRAALDRGRADPRNADVCRNRAGVVQSVVSLPRAPAQPWLAARPGVPAGLREDVAGPDRRRLAHYAAPGIGDGAPLLIVLDGEVWDGSAGEGGQDLPTTLDNLVADGVLPPLRAVLLPSGGRDARWSGMGSVGGGGATSYVVDRLLPWLAESGRLPSADRVGVVGQSLGGLTALRLALAHPDRIGVALSQSASLWLDGLETEIAAATAAAGDAGGVPVRVHLAHGRQEWVLAPPHHDLAGRLRAAGVVLEEVAYNGGHDYAWWRGAVADALVWAWGSASAGRGPVSNHHGR